MQDLNIVIGGAAGEGIQTIGAVLADTAAAHGYAVFSWQEFESRIRGGQNSYSIRIGEEPRNAPLFDADILLTLNEGAAGKYGPLLKEDGIAFAPEQFHDKIIAIPFAEIAKEELGNRIYGNTIAVGALAGALGADLEVLQNVLASRFSAKGDEIVEANRKAAERGYRAAQKSCKDACPWRLPPQEGRYCLISATESTALGAAHAGCRFIAAYPMSPSTGIITYFAQNEDRLGVFSEQAEDEIAAVNMAIGASYAGARAMTATSGGGFALMVEGVSLAGMTETPVVIVLAQRPGPATGLPTRTAQGDLLFTINAGHGEFPKLVLAPADPKDAFHKMVRAFNLADKLQSPVVVLTDQYLADSSFCFDSLEPEKSAPEFHLADPGSIQDYRRYELTESGLSPRLYPGQSRHLVCADSDEHDEAGHITEDLETTAPGMVHKRLKKFRALQKEVKPPEELETENAEHVLVGWGSSRQAMVEALGLLQEDGVKAGMIHFTEVWPLPDYRFPENKQYWTVEGNATSQLAQLLRSEYAVSFRGSVNRYDGLPLSADFIRRTFHDIR